jgi:hypothetical protein
MSGIDLKRNKVQDPGENEAYDDKLKKRFPTVYKAFAICAFCKAAKGDGDE